MNSQDFLNFFLVISLIVTVGCFVFITYFLLKALKAITSLVENLDSTTQGLKDKVQLKALATVPAILLALVGRILKKRR